jgi:hypothetical protein
MFITFHSRMEIRRSPAQHARARGGMAAAVDVSALDLAAGGTLPYPSLAAFPGHRSEVILLPPGTTTVPCRATAAPRRPLPARSAARQFE